MIHVEHLHKRYGTVTAVDDLSFDAEPGETFAMIGPNGAGKTTTLKVLLGLARPDSGTVAIRPERLAPADPLARVALGYVPQRVQFPPARTVRETLLRAWAYSTRDRRAKKRQFRRLWVIRINAAARQRGMSYSAFIDGLKKAGIDLDRKVLSELAIHDPKAFDQLVEDARSARA